MMGISPVVLVAYFLFLSYFTVLRHLAQNDEPQSCCLRVCPARPWGLSAMMHLRARLQRASAAAGQAKGKRFQWICEINLRKPITVYNDSICNWAVTTTKSDIMRKTAKQIIIAKKELEANNRDNRIIIDIQYIVLNGIQCLTEWKFYMPNGF